MMGRVRVVSVVLAACVVGALVIVAGELVTRDGGERTVVTATPEDGIRAWLAGHRDEVFPTYEGAYIGACPESGAAQGICSIARDDLGARQIHGVGVYATNWGAELLLERSTGGPAAPDAGWRVIATWPWGDPGDAEDPPVYGPPWSPHTAIAEWWAGHGADRYPGRPPVTYVHDCDTSGADPSITEQTLVCSTLERATDERRVYRTGLLAGAAGPSWADAVTLVLDHRPDHAWAVSVRDG
jgi:hypothetical protein